MAGTAAARAFAAALQAAAAWICCGVLQLHKAAAAAAPEQGQRNKANVCCGCDCVVFTASLLSIRLLPQPCKHPNTPLCCSHLSAAVHLQAVQGPATAGCEHAQVWQHDQGPCASMCRVGSLRTSVLGGRGNVGSKVGCAGQGSATGGGRVGSTGGGVWALTCNGVNCG